MGGVGPKEDTTSIGGVGDRDDYNFLPYFQGLKIQYIGYDGNSVVLNTSNQPMDWQDVPQGNGLNGRGTGTSTYWSNAGFLPKFIDQMFVYSNTTGTITGYTDLSNGIIFFPDWNGASGGFFPAGDKNGCAFSLPNIFPTTNVNTAGKYTKSLCV